MNDFADLELAAPLLRAISEEGYTAPTPIQAKAIPPLLDGRDLLGVAQTGTGKTAAFALPLLHRLTLDVRKLQPIKPCALILAPTRELARQIGDSFSSYSRHTKLRVSVVFGGVSIKPQIKSLAKGVHVLVATPGRLLDLMNKDKVHLDAVEIYILDEADRMLDMGFIHDVKRITVAVARRRQTALFSATMPKSVQGLASNLLLDPVRVEVTPTASTPEKVKQRVLFVAKDKKRALLSELMENMDLSRVLIFTRTKHGANRVTKHLEQIGVGAAAIHGNKSQGARERVLKNFRNGKLRALVATDIAARGIDVDDVSHVINFDLPNEPENYVHRIGRTARAGATGIAISFCDPEERGYLASIEKIIRHAVPVDESHSYHFAKIMNDPGFVKPNLQRDRGHRKRRRYCRPAARAA